MNILNIETNIHFNMVLVLFSFAGGKSQNAKVDVA